MKLKQKKPTKKLLSDKLADALIVKPRADIEDDQVFGTKPKIVSREDIDSSDGEIDLVISDIRKRNVKLLNELSNKYEGKVTSQKKLRRGSDTGSEDTDSENELSVSKKNDKNSNISEDTDGESEDYSINQFKKQLNEETKSPQRMNDDNSNISDESDDEGEDFSITQFKKNFKDTKSPKQIPDEKSNSSDDSDGESEDYSITQFKKQLNDDSEESEEDADGSENEDDEDNTDEGEGYDISQMDEPLKETFEHVKKQNVSEEAKKGNAVRSQLLIWEGLLEMRIHLQRCVNTVNQMPLPDKYQELKENNKFVEETNTCKNNIATVLDKMLSLQNLLLNNYSETKTLCSKKQIKDAKENIKKQEDSEEEIPSDTDNEEIPSDTDAEEETPKAVQTNKNINISTQNRKRKLEEYETEISNKHKAFKTFRDNSIQKWNDKTRLATATNIKNTPTNTVLQQISYILSDREKLVRRTQLKRSEYDILGYKKNVSGESSNENGTEEIPGSTNRKENDEYISEIFDDSDFYHQLLRELIECKSADISDPVQLSRQWIALQQMRSKMKRKVDTKASKGRKIKYVVHNKLVNFMAQEKNMMWTEESKNELYSSLFGKLFEQNNVGINTNGFKLKD